MRFYANKQKEKNGEHEIHTGTCLFLPQNENRIDLGEYNSCIKAIDKAKEHFKKVNGCVFCSNICHEK